MMLGRKRKTFSPSPTYVNGNIGGNVALEASGPFRRQVDVLIIIRNPPSLGFETPTGRAAPSQHKTVVKRQPFVKATNEGCRGRTARSAHQHGDGHEHCVCSSGLAAPTGLRGRH